MVAAHSAEVILIDHISMLVSGNEGDDRKNLDIAMTRLRTLCAEMSVAMLLVSHLSPKRRQRPRGRRSHLSISSAWLSCHRTAFRRLYWSSGRPSGPRQRRETSACLKEPLVGETGHAGTLHYTRSDGRLREDILAYCNKSKNKQEQHMALRQNTTLPPKMRREVDIFVEDYQPHHGENRATVRIAFR